ncbi:MAG: deoxyribodipyrimidine photo-lyase, partial [Rhizobiaceae bacterium]|nr:deoxyribodipyrimidine photo-lyase [Rhizobiaceae bacterium]
MLSLPNTEQKPLLLWFRKDLRLDDNHALNAACASGSPVIPIYIREPGQDGLGPLGGAQRWWLHHSLSALQMRLRSLGSELILESGDALMVLLALCEKTGATAVHWNRRYEPAGMSVDTRVKEVLREHGIEARSFAGQILHEPSRVMTG